MNGISIKVLRRQLVATPSAVLTVVGVLSVAMASLPARAASAVPACSGHSNPYLGNEAGAEACGLITSTRTTATELSGGGWRYDYTIPGAGVTSIYVPPANFDPSTANAQTLKLYGLPSAPVDAGLPAMEAWTAAMKAARFPAAAPPFLAESSTKASPVAQSPADSENGEAWSGYLARGQFTLSYADWFEPQYGATAGCSKVGDFIWTGLGGCGVADLGQDGTAFGSTGIGNGQAWEEVLPQQGGVDPLNLSASADDYMYAIAQWSPGSYVGTVEDETSGAYESWSHSGNYPSSNETGEAIIEDPGGDGLVNFKSLQFANVYENGYSMDHYSPNGVRSGLNSYNGSDELATAGNVGTDGQFVDTWIRCK